MVTQITAILPSRRGASAELIEVLSESGVAWRALCVVDTAEFGLARFVPEDAETARACLDNAGIPCSVAPVVEIASTEPDAVAAAVRRLARRKIAAQYLYCGAPGARGPGVTVLGCDDPERAAEGG